MYLLKVLHVIWPALLAAILVSGQQNSSTNNESDAVPPEERSIQQRGPYYQANEAQPAPANQQANDEADAALDNLSFKLMNHPRERLQAVQNLVDSQQAHLPSPPELNHSVLDQLAVLPAMPQCHHKGQQYKHGQTVPIEDQPCLNCTCHRAVLQCYLRVCPPIHSANAERRHIENSGRGLDLSKNARPICSMHKEPNQCCPTIKCESSTEATNLNRTATSQLDAQTSSTTTTSSVHRHSINLDTDTVSAAHEPVEERGASKQTLASNHVHQTLHNRSIEQIQDTQLQAHQTTDLAESPTSSVPKLTVINGATGQRDSILLITSNQGGQTTERPMGDIHRGDFSNALIEALLETVYSSGAQLSGLNLEGSCMINGSLYIEGSAVIPEGNAFCQYCYCIRQKIMCVKPKCQLIISGCTPKYSNEYACCPTSYSCNQSGQSFSLATRTPLTHRSGSPLELSHDVNQTQALSARLWSAIESLSKHLGRPTRHNQDLREALEPPVHTTTTTTPEPTTHPTTPLIDTTTITAANQRTSTPPVDTSTSSLETSTRQPTDTSTEFGTRISPLSADTEPVELSERSREPQAHSTETSEPMEQPTSTTSPDQTPSSVSDFLEPMNKLGPLVVSPAAPSSCIENGRHYSIGEQIPTLESCKHCYCGLDGLKECKMVECSLMMNHNCKPVIPEGHCCPVRYECPTGSGLSTGARYRSEPLCTGGPRDGPECHNSSGSKIDESSIELNRTSASESLTDELNKFIMRINPTSPELSNDPPQPNTELPAQVSTSPFEPQLKSQEAAINEQNSQIVFQDYPTSTQLPTEPLSTGTISPEEPPAGRTVSGSSEPVVFSSTTQTTLGNDNEGVSVATIGQRDSRSTDSRIQVLSELLEEQKRRNQLESSSKSNSEEYSVDIAQGTALAEAGPKFLAHQKSINHSQMVVFDDELLSSHNLVNNTSRAQPATEFITGDWIEPSTVTSTDPSNLDVSTPGSTSTPARIEPTTTGTPFGLAADRSPETRGWLQSLHGLVSSFGRRLAGSTPVAVDSAGSGQVFSGNELQSGAKASQSSRIIGETARSRSPSLFNQILKSVIGEVEEPLIMRPLSGDQMTHRSDQLDISASSLGNEIPSALSSVAPGTPTQTSAPSFASGETLMGSDSTPQIQIHRLNNNDKLLARPQPTHASLTCYEPLTNRTYLANEIIPKDDPCKTCTCVLGEELCQNLVCPEKPGSNCKVEERPGECCPNYLCGGKEVLNSLPMPRVNLINDPVPISDPSPQLDLARNNQPMRQLPISTLHNLPKRLPVTSYQTNHQTTPNLNWQQLKAIQNLANFLPPHLRFRPNNLANTNINQSPQMSLLYTDRNKILFNNQRVSTVQDLNANNLGNFNSQRLNLGAPVISPYSRNPLLLDQFNNRGPTNIRLPVIMHPNQQQHPSVVGMNSGLHQMIAPPLYPLVQQQTNLLVPAPTSTTNSPVPSVLATSQPQQMSRDAHSQSQDIRKAPFEPSNELHDNSNNERVIFPNQIINPDFDSGFKPINLPVSRPTLERIKPPPTTIAFNEVRSSSTEQSWSPDYTVSPTTTTTTTTTSSPKSSSQDSVEFDFKAEESGDEQKDGPSSSSDNLMSMFKVSECNIYGHIYKVGDIVDSLSDSCKRCTCSSTGVECRNVCS